MLWIHPNYSVDWPEPFARTEMLHQSSDTTAFVEFYRDITLYIESLLISSGNLTVDETNFLRFLYFGFWWEYKPKWMWSPIRGLLNRIQNKAVKALQVSCQAYIHMAFDLPRVIADAMTATPSIPLSTLRMKKVFYEMDGIFDVALEDQFKKFGAVGVFCIASWLGKSLSPSQIAVIWVHAIRARSFYHAEVLVEAQRRGPMCRQVIERDLLFAVIAAVDKVINNRFNPASWFTFLRSPAVAVPCVLPFLLLGILNIDHQLGAFQLLHWKAEALSVIGSATAYIGLAYNGLRRLVYRAGLDVAEAVEQVMNRAAANLYSTESIIEGS